MNLRRHLAAAALLFSLFTIHHSLFAAASSDRAAQWTTVTAAAKAGQPKTASAALDGIITSALADKAWPEAIRAILIKTQTDASTENHRDQAATAIKTLAAWLAATQPAATAPASDFSSSALQPFSPFLPLPAEMRPLLEAALAKTWWAYYQANRWQLLQRNRTAAEPSDNFLTWDAARVLAETAHHFEAALADPTALQRTPITAFDDLLAKGALPDTYRPTLFDFLTHEAIAFYSAGDQGIPAAENRFEPELDSPLLGTLEDFLAWSPANPGSAGIPPALSGTGAGKMPALPATTDPTLRALQLYQSLLRFHLSDANPQLALADADLARINWAAQLLGAQNTDTRARHLAALRAFIERATANEPGIALTATLKLAELLEKEDPAAAVTTAERGTDLARETSSPNTDAANALRNLITRITAPSLQTISTERTWIPASSLTPPASTNPPPPADITIRYRNQKQIHFRAIAANWEDFLQKDHSRPENLSPKELVALLKKRAAKTWTAQLPATPDYRYRNETFPAPAAFRDLKPGFYFIVASLDQRFIETENLITYTPVWVSNLALIRSETHDGTLSGFVVNATTGDPVPDATINAWRSGDSGERIQTNNATTDDSGAFAIESPLGSDTRSWRNYVALARTPDGDAISTAQPFYIGQPSEKTPREIQAHFFTDRSIYRPGQTIQFKAVVLNTNPDRAKYAVVANRTVRIVLNDPNGKEAGKLELRTNDYGSLTGSFTVPAGRLTGYYSLTATSGAQGGTGIRIEEYKRPKFEVTLPAPETAPKLDAEVTLTGTATAYTGAPIDGAKVTWRVQRLVRWPRWCWWFISNPTITNREIAHGTTTTDATGKYTLTFTALPDKTADAKNEPIFDYAITTEVTDTTGETRTASRTISVGYTALAADISADEWQTTEKPVALKLSTTTLDRIGQTVTGTVTLHALQQPATVLQAKLNNNDYYYGYDDFETPNAKLQTPNSPPKITADIRTWPEEKTPVATSQFTTDAKTGLAEITQKLPAGLYRAILTTTDRFGKSVTARTEIRVITPDATRYTAKEDFIVTTPAWKARPGETFTAIWGSGYDTARALVTLSQDGKTLRQFWTTAAATQQKIEIPITEKMRGGVTLSIFQVRDNRLVSKTRTIEIPWDNKDLKITWEHFNSKLIPGGRETWTAKITTPTTERGLSSPQGLKTDRGLSSPPNPAEHIAAEFAAALYDASLDQFNPHNWNPLTNIFRREYSRMGQWQTTNAAVRFSTQISDLKVPYAEIKSGAPYRYWNDSILLYLEDDIVELSAFRVGGSGYSTRTGGIVARAAAPAPAMAMKTVLATDSFGSVSEGNAGEYLKQLPGVSTEAEQPPHAPDLATVTARKNLSETAFFYPQLLTEADGTVRIEFTAPEALTRWKFLAFAHDKQLRSAIFTDTAVTAKDLMVQPNPPRFLREGDTVEFTVKVTNRTDTPQTGTAQLTFADATTLEAVNLADSSTGNRKLKTVNFSLAANSSQTLSWRITIPDGQGFLTYKAVASTGAVSDGEEGYLPVLSRRQLVTESIALPIRGPGTKTFRFAKLADSVPGTAGVPPAPDKAGKMPALPGSGIRHESLTVQMTSNPAWYAVLALPTLMEFPHECTEQLFNRYYANALAAHIANSDPKIARIFEQWRSAPTVGASLATPGSSSAALDSPLLKNEDLKSVLIEETPWLRTATRESEQRRAIGNLFDTNRTANASADILRKLADRQLPDGRWAWFPGGNGSDYITRYLVAGFARLRAFGVKLDPAANDILQRAIPALDVALAKRYAELFASKNFQPNDNHLTSADVFQLYARTLFTKEIPITDTAVDEAYGYFINQICRYWRQLPRQSQGHAALVLHRLKLSKYPQLIVESLRQRAKNSEELGMYWTDTERGWFWWQAPIETQALMIELFDEVAKDAQAVSDLQLWLLKQKQTQAWPSTKATADAVYALLLRGADKLASDALVTVQLGDKKIAPEKNEAGTGFYTERIPGVSITPTMGEKITVTKTDAGPAWGSVTWQYFQSIDKITPHEGTPLTLKKTIYKQINTPSGLTLIPITDATGAVAPTGNRKLKTVNSEPSRLAPGDTLIVRIELRTDRDMEFVHLKDQRGSGTEPVNVLSGYRWKNGLGYYESTRDTASHFFMDWLPKGTHVFEYPVRVQLRGSYESGIAEIQCMYAPEYNSHSASTTLTVE